MTLNTILIFLAGCAIGVIIQSMYTAYDLIKNIDEWHQKISNLKQAKEELEKTRRGL